MQETKASHQEAVTAKERSEKAVGEAKAAAQKLKEKEEDVRTMQVGG